MTDFGTLCLLSCIWTTAPMSYTAGGGSTWVGETGGRGGGEVERGREGSTWVDVLFTPEAHPLVTDRNEKQHNSANSNSNLPHPTLRFPILLPYPTI